MPDPFVLVLLLTLITWAITLPLTLATQSSTALASHWFKGFWQLLGFSMQMVLIVTTGEALALTRPIKHAFGWIAHQPTSPRGALLLISSIALASGFVHWGFGLMGSALLARETAAVMHRRKIPLHYPLLGTAAYLSMLLWHAGLTATAPLLIQTPGHFLQAQIGLVPLSETLLLPMNAAACTVLFLAMPWILVGMHPTRNQDVRTIRDFVESELNGTQIRGPERPLRAALRTPAERLDHAPWIGRAAGSIGLLVIILEGFRGALEWNHNTINLGLLSLGLTIHGSPAEYARAIGQSVRGTAGIVLQYPFYGGIMGLIEGSGLGARVAELATSFSTAGSLPFFAYVTATFTKLFVPSGGGEWAIEGPVFLKAAQQLGAPLGRTTMGIAYGNMVGNLFQPFWSLPLLGVLGLRARDIMGYCLVGFLFAFPWLGICLLVF